MALTPEDFMQIQTLYSRYTFATDFGPADTWVDCFATDGSIEIRGATHRGRDALQKFAQGMKGPASGNRHWNGNLLIEESSSGANTTATGRAYITIFQTHKTPREVNLTGRYDDTLVKTPQGWKFASRKITFDQ
jgi:hypothetical protein